MQARAEAIEELITGGILEDVLDADQDEVERELSRLARAEAVETELARLKAELGQTQAAQPEAA